MNYKMNHNDEVLEVKLAWGPHRVWGYGYKVISVKDSKGKLLDLDEDYIVDSLVLDGKIAAGA